MSTSDSDSTTQAFDWRAHLAVHPAAELFPRMSEEELKAFADDVLKNGLRTGVVLYGDRLDLKTHQLLDGRNRLDALALLGILGLFKGHVVLTKQYRNGEWIKSELGYSTVVRNFVDEDADGNACDPYALALSYNVHRRHLTAEQKRELIGKLLKADPAKSNIQVAKAAKVDDKTVAKVRTTLEATSEIPKLEKTRGKDGKVRPAKKATTYSRTPEQKQAATESRLRSAAAILESRKVGNSVDAANSAEARKAVHATVDGQVTAKPPTKLAPWITNYVARIRTELGYHRRDHAAEVSILCAALRDLINEFEGGQNARHH